MEQVTARMLLPGAPLPGWAGPGPHAEGRMAHVNCNHWLPLSSRTPLPRAAADPVPREKGPLQACSGPLVSAPRIGVPVAYPLPSSEGDACV